MEVPVGMKSSLHQMLRSAHQFHGALLAAHASSGAAASISALVPMTHSSLVGQVVNVVPIAAGSHNRATNNRAVVAVQHKDPYTKLEDATVLFIDRCSGTDSEYFSSDYRVNIDGLQ